MLWFSPEGLGWSLDDVVAQSKVPATVYPDADQIVTYLRKTATAGDHVVIMSNGGFAGIHQKLLTALAE